MGPHREESRLRSYLITRFLKIQSTTACGKPKNQKANVQRRVRFLILPTCLQMGKWVHEVHVTITKSPSHKGLIRSQTSEPPESGLLPPELCVPCKQSPNTSDDTWPHPLKSPPVSLGRPLCLFTRVWAKAHC